jgi:hypothetical protein
LGHGHGGNLTDGLIGLGIGSCIGFADDHGRSIIIDDHGRSIIIGTVTGLQQDRSNNHQQGKNAKNDPHLAVKSLKGTQPA